MAVAEAQQYLGTVLGPLIVLHSSQALYGEALRLIDRLSPRLA
jgi:hypothetical protein